MYRRQDGVLHYILRQCVSLVLIVAGLLISIPGVPGPGFLIVFLGFLLLSFPGKRRVLNSLSHRRTFRQARVCLRKRVGITLVLP